MAFRGRGRGRGWGRGAGLDARRGTPMEYVLFPDDVKLPSLPDIKRDGPLCRKKHRLEIFWRGSCYHLDESSLNKKRDDREIERYSDSIKKEKRSKRESLASYMKLTTSNFPSELLQGMKGLERSRKKLRWDKDAAKTLDLLEKLETTSKDQEKTEKEKGAESDNESEKEESEEESSDEGDYEQNVDFDDDEDDMNMADDPDEDTYEDF